MNPTFDNGVVRLYQANAQSLPLEDASVDCVVTSPPYWGLRDYGTGTWDGGDAACDHKRTQGDLSTSTAGYNANTNHAQEPWPNGVCGKCGATREDNQLGLEPTPEAYVANMVAVFREVWRVLKPHGTVWLNLGDSYYTQPAGNKTPSGFQQNGTGGQAGALAQFGGNTKMPKLDGLKPKDLVGIPWRVAFALQADGWWLRSDIIWAKPNPMPESVTDRPTKAHEYVFLLTKSSTYYYDADAIREPAQDWGTRDRTNMRNGTTDPLLKHHGLVGQPAENGRNKRTVWEITTQPYSEAHFATFPEGLVRPCILAGTSERGVCSVCGKPWERVVERTAMEIDRSERTHELGRTRSSGTMTKPPTSTTTGWQPTCAHDAPTVPATVLDPFSGSGTTAMVAQKLGRKAIGADLSAEYLAMAAKRIGAVSLPMAIA